MARDPELTESRNRKLCDYFERLRNKKVFGTRIYSADGCVALTARHFDLKPRTVERIVYG